MTTQLSSLGSFSPEGTMKALQQPASLVVVGTGIQWGGQEVDLLDLVSMINASGALSSEIRIDRLLQRLMALLIESAAARTGYLLIDKDGQWVVEAGQSAERGLMTILESVPMDQLQARGYGGLATSVVDYVGRTGEALILDDASASDHFARDSYIVARKAASILCFPLKRQNGVAAIAYLENNLARGVFTAGRLKVLEMLSTQAAISLDNARMYERLEQINESLEQKIESRTRELREKNQRLTDMQRQLVTQEKLAALGALTAGIAHEIKNPLNFVSNFAGVSSRLVDEIVQCLDKQKAMLAPSVCEELESLLGDLRQAVKKIGEHGVRAGAIVGGMAMHARDGSSRRESADLNAILAQSLTLASHSANRGGATELQIAADFDARIGPVDMVVQDMSRVFVNLINNARYAVMQKRRRLGRSFSPQLAARTIDRGGQVEVRVRDNGQGIPAHLMDKIFIPFFTTKPPGEGSGLGLSISHDIVVREHGGTFRVESLEGEFTEFVIVLPKKQVDAELGVSSTS